MPVPTAEITRLYPQILSRARALSRDADLAQDLAQATLERLWRRLEAGPPVADPRAYGFGILRNLWRDHLRGAEPLAEVPDLAALPQTGTAAAADGLACRDVARAIGRLPPPQRDLLRLLLTDEPPSYATLARRMAVPQGTVMSRLSRARRALRAELALEGGPAVAALIGE
jgi:RNA polymerase sigma-70 factor (ECF subfamily)